MVFQYYRFYKIPITPIVESAQWSFLEIFLVIFLKPTRVHYLFRSTIFSAGESKVATNGLSLHPRSTLRQLQTQSSYKYLSSFFISFSAFYLKHLFSYFIEFAGNELCSLKNNIWCKILLLINLIINIKHQRYITVSFSYLINLPAQLILSCQRIDWQVCETYFGKTILIR